MLLLKLRPNAAPIHLNIRILPQDLLFLCCLIKHSTYNHLFFTADRITYNEFSLTCNHLKDEKELPAKFPYPKFYISWNFPRKKCGGSHYPPSPPSFVSVSLHRAFKSLYYISCFVFSVGDTQLQQRGAQTLILIPPPVTTVTTTTSTSS